MLKINNIVGHTILDKAAKIGVICTRFNSFIVDHLESGCLDALRTL